MASVHRVDCGCERCVMFRAKQTPILAPVLTKVVSVMEQIRDAVAGGYGFMLTEKDATRLIGEIDALRSPEPTPARVCPDSADGQHVLKQDGPFSIVYCDACGMNRGWRTQEPEPLADRFAKFCHLHGMYDATAGNHCPACVPPENRGGSHGS